MAVIVAFLLSLILFPKDTLYQSVQEPVRVNTMEESVEEVAEERDTISRWLELPSYDEEECGRFVVTHMAQMGDSLQRNYTLLYDAENYAALWVAYPLCASHVASGREETWNYDPKIPYRFQTRVSRGYGVSKPTVNYPSNFYARGHQIPNADRSAVPQMQAQTYFSSNITPQIQHGFNGGIWAKLESAVRTRIPLGDTLYVVTGASFYQAECDEPVDTVLNRNDSKLLPVPNYYWKALLKVVREDGQITGAKTIGFWLPHEDLKGHSYLEYVVSVDQIEEWTGFDLFPGLPRSIEESAESKSSWFSF